MGMRSNQNSQQESFMWGDRKKKYLDLMRCGRRGEGLKRLSNGPWVRGGGLKHTLRKFMCRTKMNSDKKKACEIGLCVEREEGK